jgi:N-acetylmuramoyl-L-alanine amidase
MRVEGIMRTISKLAAVLLVGAALAGPAAHAASAQTVRTLYTRALTRERTLRDASSRASLRELRRGVSAYQLLVRRYPASAYCDNALWQAANLSILAYERFEDPSDLRTAQHLLAQLKREYPSSSLRTRVDEVTRQFEAAPALAAAKPLPVAASATPDTALVTIREIRRTLLPDGARVTIEMDGESLYRQERLENPRRLFFDLKGARTTAPLQDAAIKYSDGVVTEIRLGRHPHNTTRVVMDMEGVDTYSVFTLYNPFRLIVDFKRAAGVVPAVAAATTGVSAAVSAPSLPPGPPAARVLKLDAKPLQVPEVPPSPGGDALIPVAPIPTAPSENLNGQFSLARQLGLGISRIVIDAGHGGHDPGARSNGLNEADLVLDVASRLRTLLEKQPAIEVTMTRQTDVFIPLEQRTAIANREGADLFLSIHANASRNAKARGVETYFLNFASNPEAEAVAARENSTSGRTMHSLPEIVRAIALNNKIDESRDFADMVQKSMVRRLAARNGQLRDLGVRQAPFVVLIGAGMPSVLAEISFLTNKQEAQLLKTGAYRQQIAEALHDAILRYQGSLKKVRAVAAKE